MDVLNRLDRWLSTELRPAGLRNLWNRLWVREDEFHPSLNMDFEVVLKMNESQREQYAKDLISRREIAQERDLEAD